MSAASGDPASPFTINLPEGIKPAVADRIAGKVAHPRRRAVHRILGYLSRIHHGPETGLEHVYFGHTHDALQDYRYRGVTFHNPGAPMPGLAFRIVEVPTPRQR